MGDRGNIFLPVIRGKGKIGQPCGQNPVSLRMAEIFIESEWQNRVNPRCDPRLAMAAQTKAEDMLKWRYAGHVMHNGDSANQNIRSTGYTLPPWYLEDENNVESYGVNLGTPELMFVAWKTSISHWTHIAALHPFFVEQECFGTGYVEGPEDVGKYYVLVSAPCSE